MLIYNTVHSAFRLSRFFLFAAISTPVQPEIRARLEAAAKEVGLKYDDR